MSKSEKETTSLLKLEKEGEFDLWHEHMRALKSWDDLSLARWLNQTLGQLFERSWRASHPLVLAYRLGAAVAHQRDLWNRRILSIDAHYQPTDCCRAPSIPFVTFEACTHGIYCSCCGEVLLMIEELEASLASSFKHWSSHYEAVHSVAHWSEEERKRYGDYDEALDRASARAVPLLSRFGYQLVPRFLQTFPTVFWEDSDHCLDILPEEIPPVAE